jgi:fucose permease
MQGNRSSRTDLYTVIVANIGFIGLGMTVALLGLAWPTMRLEFQVPLDATAVLLLGSTVGSLSASFLSGSIAYRFGTGHMFVAAAFLSAFGLLAVSLNHIWLLMPIFMLVTGFGNGLIDAGFNAYTAQHHNARSMNWLHGCFGIGTTIGPLVMTAVLSGGNSWRVGYVAASAVMVAVGIFLVLARAWWRPVIVQSEATNAQRKSTRAVLRMSSVWFGIALFFMCAGLETIPGTWVYTLFTQARHIGEVPAGLWVSIYWGSFTVGRFFFGAIVTRVNPLALARFCLGGVVVGALLLWWNPAEWVGFAGLTLMGFMLAPLFPIFVSDTPKRVGMENAGNAIGFQVAGAGFGTSVLPAIAGFLANNTALNAILPYIFACAIITVVIHELRVSQGAKVDTRTVATSTIG